MYDDHGRGSSHYSTKGRGACYTTAEHGTQHDSDDRIKGGVFGKCPQTCQPYQDKCNKEHAGSSYSHLRCCQLFTLTKKIIPAIHDDALIIFFTSSAVSIATGMKSAFSYLR